MKVFVVTTGCYSNYGIRGIFSTLAKAQQYMNQCIASEECWYKDFNEIEKWSLDAALGEREYMRFMVGIMLDDGSVKEQYDPQIMFGLPKSRHYIAETLYSGRGIVRAESHKSAEHAMKLAVEARQAWLRENPKK